MTYDTREITELLVTSKGLIEDYGESLWIDDYTGTHSLCPICDQENSHSKECIIGNTISKIEAVIKSDG